MIDAIETAAVGQFAVLTDRTVSDLFLPADKPVALQQVRESAPESGAAHAPPAVGVDTAARSFETPEWRQLFCEVTECTACDLRKSRRHPVLDDGNRRAELMFIGEAPGEEEDRQGVPFVGAAGHLLDKMIAAMQFKREDVYIANVVKCHPQKNRNPNPNEVAACLPFLLRQIEMVGPRVIVLLGAVPLAALFHKTGITRIHGEWLDFHGIPTLPTFHPAYLLRYADAKRQAWDDLKKVMQFLGKAPPQKPSRKP